ncbi:MAG: two-component system, NarL family, sensor kinase [Actinomycetota bacterium]|nr:two-component system, NarL family, sensor kinase [Actinomycetota bacterium]
MTPPLIEESPEESPAKTNRSAVRRAMTRFVAGSLLALILVGLATSVVARNIAEAGALRDARSRGGLFGRAAAVSLINSAVRSGDKEQLGRLDYVMRNRLLDGSIVHIKMWDSSGTVIWSDERGLRGHKFELEPAVQNIFGTDKVLAGMTTLSKAENQKEVGEGPLFEVYTAAWDADGVPVVLESYWSTTLLAADQRAIVRRVEPLALGSLILFQLALFPLALSLARRVDHGSAERSRMLRHALSASELERRRIAQDLHDGVIQDLSGLGYVLPTVYSQLPDTPRADAARSVLQKISSVVERDVASLRSLLTDLYPERLAPGGLVSAIEELVRTPIASGLAVSVDVERAAGESMEVNQLTYRVIREGLRNVVAHAEARSARIGAERRGTTMLVTVTDDGKGLRRDESAETGHLGLRLLADMLHDVGGTLDLSPGAAGGAVLTATFPVSFASD